MVTVDANIWHQAFPRYLILNLHQGGMYNVQWSDIIWDECERSLRELARSLKDRVQLVEAGDGAS